MDNDTTTKTQAKGKATADVSSDQEDVLPKAERVVDKYWKIAAGIGLVPIPFVDILGATTVQLTMLKELCDVYGKRFSKNLGKSAIGSLAGGFASNVGTATVVSLMKSVPVLGTAVGVVAQPAVFGASTYALGKVFIQHFDSGGTLFTFDPRQVREYYSEQKEAGKQVVDQQTSTKSKS